MSRSKNTQLDLPAVVPRDERWDGPLEEGEAEKLRELLPSTVQLGTAGWRFPGWDKLVWHGPRALDSLELTGLAQYAAHPLLTTLFLGAGADPTPSERDLRRYVAQLPDDMHCVLQVHPEVTYPRFWHSDDERVRAGRAGQANPHFLDARFFEREILRVYNDVFGERLGPFVFSFPPTLARSGIAPATLAERLYVFFSELPEDFAWAVEVREPEYLTLDYARVLAMYSVSHVFTTWAGMPSLQVQAQKVATSPELIVHFADPTGQGEARRRRLEPYDHLTEPQDVHRRRIVELVDAMHGYPTYVLVHNEAEGCAPLTIFALARMLAARQSA